jgi:hypothetical protein
MRWCVKTGSCSSRAGRRTCRPPDLHSVVHGSPAPELTTDDALAVMTECESLLHLHVGQYAWETHSSLWAVEEATSSGSRFRTSVMAQRLLAYTGVTEAVVARWFDDARTPEHMTRVFADPHDWEGAFAHATTLQRLALPAANADETKAQSAVPDSGAAVVRLQASASKAAPMAAAAAAPPVAAAAAAPEADEF